MLLALLLVAGYETALRSGGHVPSVVDDRDLWAVHRRRATGDAVVLLGGSRIQLGFSTATFRDRFPDRPIVQLAIDGTAPLATLADLADDDGFRGIALVSALPVGLRAATRESQRPWVRHHHREFSANRRINRGFRTAIQSSLACVNPSVSPPNFMGHLYRTGSLPGPSYLVTHPDRSRSADYSRIDIARHRAWRIESTRESYAKRSRPTPSDWERDLEVWRALVDRIHGRGGTVVFVRMPTTGASREMDEAYAPRADFWDRIAGRTGTATIHFEDLPGLAEVECPDTSHLDRRDTPRFTSALLDELVRLGILE